MALIDKASLLMVPSTYEAGKLYNVLPSGNRAPDSTDQNSGYDQTRADFDFDRGSNASATRIGSDGLIKKYRENLFTNSNMFTGISLDGITRTTAQADPFGGSNAVLFTESTNTGTHRWYNTTSITSSAVYTISVFAKANGVTDLQIAGAAGIIGRFDLSTGEAFTSGIGIDANIKAIGTDGWYRCSATYNGGGWIGLYLAQGTAISYTGDGTSGVYAYGYQVEKSLVASSYLESTSVTGKAGVLVDLPRINYDANGQNGSLLLEPSRVNLITQSEYFGSYTPLSATITDNVATSPEGVLNAASFIETTASGRHRTQTNSFAVTSGSTYTLSMFAKIASGSRLLCLNADYLFNARAYFNLVSGSVEGIDSGSASIEDYGNGWYRCSITGTSTITGSSIAYFGLEDGASDNGYIGDGTSGHYWYGLQAESGSYVSSYIPTMGTSETRAADSFNVNSISAHINSVEGTIYLEAEALHDDNTYRGISINDGTFTNMAQIRFSNTSNQITAQYKTGGSNSCLISEVVTDTTQRQKIAFRYKANDFKMYVNGVNAGSDTSGATNSANTFDEIKSNRGDGNDVFYGRVYKYILFDEGLSNSELESLTS